MNSPRAGHTATLLGDGTVLLAGGESQDEAVKYAEIYLPGSHQYIPTGDLAINRSEHTATLLSDGAVLIVGGADGAAPAELYDPLKQSFSKLPGRLKARLLHTATRLKDGKVLITGGKRRPGSQTPMDSAEIYDPIYRTFTATGDLKRARHSHSATLLGNGKVLIAGGCGQDEEPEQSAELFDPATGAFTELASDLYTPRKKHTATLLHDGTVLLAGGSDQSMSSEIFDPETQLFKQFHPTANRFTHTATLLKSGRVVLAGGFRQSDGGDGPIHKSFEYIETGQPEDQKAPILLAHPLSQTVQEGGNATFSVMAEGSQLNYSWWKNGVIIPGATKASLVLPSVTLEDNGASFFAQVSNESGSVDSATATLTVVATPKGPAIKKFTAQPQVIAKGETATLLAEFTEGEAFIQPGFWLMANGVPLVVKPAETTHYTLTVGKGDKQKTATITVTVK